jgi:hypothetical protein
VKNIHNKKAQKAPVLGVFINNISGETFEAYLLGTEEIEGKLFYILKMRDHQRIVKMAVSALKKSNKQLEPR